MELVKARQINVKKPTNHKKHRFGDRERPQRSLRVQAKCVLGHSGVFLDYEIAGVELNTLLSGVIWVVN